MPSLVGITVCGERSSTTVALDDWLRLSHCLDRTGKTWLENAALWVISWVAFSRFLLPASSRSHRNQGTICSSCQPRASRPAFERFLVNLKGLTDSGTGMSIGILAGCIKN